MAYSPTTWKDRTVEKPRTYTLQDNGDGTVTLVPVTGTVYEAGTPVSAANMNKIEQGIADVHTNWKQKYKLTEDSGAAVINGTDLNALTSTGYYDIGTAFVTVISNGGNWCVQLITDTTDNRSFIRRREAGVWQPQIEVITSAGGTLAGILAMEARSALPNSYSQWIQFNYVDSAGVKHTDRIFGVTADGKLHYTQFGVAEYDVWTSETLRINNGVPEYLIGGVWTPVGGIKNVQRGQVAAPATGSNTEVTISSVNTAKTFTTFNVAGNMQIGNNTGFMLELISATKVRITNTSAASPSVTLAYEVVESY